MTKTLACVKWLFIVITACQASCAQSTQDQFLPEVNLYWRFNRELRLQVQASRTRDGVSYNSATFGPTLNIFIRQFLSKRTTTADDANRNLMALGVGYRSISATDKPDENRVQLDATPKFPLPGDVLIDDRNRIDLRFITGNFTWRYRNRLTVQRTFKIHALPVTPIARAEAFYDISSNKWNKTTYSFGGIIGLTKWMDIQPYYERENNTGSNPAHINGTGLTFHAYFRRDAGSPRKK